MPHRLAEWRIKNARATLFTKTQRELVANGLTPMAAHEEARKIVGAASRKVLIEEALATRDAEARR